MQHVNDHKSGHLWDPWDFLGPKRRALLESGWTGVFRKHLLEELPVEEIAGKFHETLGRPSKELYTLTGALILQQMFDLSDEEVVRRLSFDIQWHYALDISSESDAEKYVCERTLREYRCMVIERSLEAVLFSTLTDKLVKVFEVDTRRQRLDSTQVLSSMRKLGRIQIMATTIRVFLRCWRRQCKNLFKKEIEKDWAYRYLDEKGFGCFSRIRPGEGHRYLEDVAKELFLLVERFKGNKKVRRMNSYRMMERVLGEQCEMVSDDGGDRTVRPKDKMKIACDSLQNPSDPDAAYNGHKGQGYTAQIMETFQRGEVETTKADLITYVGVEPANRSDGEAVVAAITTTMERGCKPEELLGDTAYGGDSNVESAAEEGVDLLTPVPGSAGHHGTLELKEFDWELDESKPIRCPEGHASKERYETKKGHYIVVFDLETCQGCNLRSRCPVKITSRSARLKYRPKKARLAERRGYEKTEEFRERYRWRAGIEATISRYKSQMGGGRVRFRGLRKVRFAVVLKALGLNIYRAGRAVETYLKGLTDPQRVLAAISYLFSLFRALGGVDKPAERTFRAREADIIAKILSPPLSTFCRVVKFEGATRLAITCPPHAAVAASCAGRA